MIRTVLLTALVAAGAVDAAVLDLAGRSNTPYCSKVNKKCCSDSAKRAEAYCSSYLGVPKITKTRTQTVCSTVTTTLSTTTTTVPAQLSTTTITACLMPTAAPAAQPDTNVAQPGPEVERGQPGGGIKRAALQKPACISETSSKGITSACKCMAIKTATTTTTKKVTDTKTKTVQTGTVTVTGAASTTTVYTQSLPTSFIVGIQDNFVALEMPQKKRAAPWYDQPLYFGINDFDGPAVTWQLNSANGHLTAIDVPDSPESVGAIAAERANDEDLVVRAADPASVADGSAVPVTCSISRAQDGTCPLRCQRSDETDTTQIHPNNRRWALGTPGTYGEAYDLFAISEPEETTETRR